MKDTGLFKAVVGVVVMGLGFALLQSDSAIAFIQIAAGVFLTWRGLSVMENKDKP